MEVLTALLFARKNVPCFDVNFVQNACDHIPTLFFSERLNYANQMSTTFHESHDVGN